jgi:hypothetical protein
MKPFAWFLAGAVLSRLVKIEVVKDSSRYTAEPKEEIPSTLRKVTIWP